MALSLVVSLSGQELYHTWSSCLTPVSNDSIHHCPAAGREVIVVGMGAICGKGVHDVLPTRTGGRNTCRVGIWVMLCVCVGRGIERVYEGCLFVAVCVHVNVDNSKFKCEYECLFTVCVCYCMYMCICMWVCGWVEHNPYILESQSCVLPRGRMWELRHQLEHVGHSWADSLSQYLVSSSHHQQMSGSVRKYHLGMERRGRGEGCSRSKRTVHTSV